MVHRLAGSMHSSKKQATERASTRCFQLRDERDPGLARRLARQPGRPQAGRAGIVDMQPPTGWAKILSPLACLACTVGGSDIHARPWTVVETDCVDVVNTTLRGGRIATAAGMLP
jgi:hypothetical protein